MTPGTDRLLFGRIVTAHAAFQIERSLRSMLAALIGRYPTRPEVIRGQHVHLTVTGIAVVLSLMTGHATHVG